MKTKKVVVGALAAMLSLSVCSLAPVVAAGETVQISVGKTNAEAGAEFSVDVSLADIPSSGIQALDFAVTYDSKVLTITKVEQGALVNKSAETADKSAALSPLFESSINSTEGFVSMIWSTSTDDASYWLKGDGVFCTIKGTVASGATSGAVADLKIVPINRETYAGSGSPNGDIGCGYEKDGKPVKLATSVDNGSVTVGKVVTTTEKPTEKIVRGDVNCDGTVDMGDAVLIMQSLANPNKYGLNGSDSKHITEQGKLNGDVDEEVKGLTSNDALKIQKYLLKLISEL
uniref:Scaffoldin C n=1 Tax=Ruminococcus flavefaciens TaxID=1265 RepID=G9FFJ5_RUMFL|nr:scaffoldin C [Ruminococcus flavefaciens]AEV59344.1 scaffoldin C [Ruminococcus flavefaciens]AEV59345.1 scaffoldin C [Ruminococcus flavefaciens]AEV59346.1 scaffoldin C [Ruminococcus flavefaciens]AEV59347.1 scaffoldin C [Ruminococcus flavefaciens]